MDLSILSLDNLLAYVLTYKYLAIFLITYAGALLLPLPSGTMLMAATAFAVQGYMEPWLVFIVGVAGNVAGDNSGYFIANKFGRPVLEKIGFKRMLYSPKFTAIEKNFEKHPFITIFMSRFLTAVAPTVNILTGLGKYPYYKYLFFEFFGEVAEVGMNCLIGYIFGSNWEYIHSLTGNIIYIIVLGTLFSSVIWGFILKGSKREAKNA